MKSQLPTRPPRSRRSRRAAALVAAGAMVGVGLTPTAVTAADELDEVVIGAFDTTPLGWTTWAEGGASSSLVQNTEDVRSGEGSAQLTVDFGFNEGTGNYTGFGVLHRGALIDQALDAQGLSFWVKAGDVFGLDVRVVDAYGESLQQRVSLLPEEELDPAAGGWQEVRITDLNSGSNFQFWGGGAGNTAGVFDGPLAQVAINLPNHQVPAASRPDGAVILVDDVSVLVPPPPPPVLDRVVLGDFESPDEGWQFWSEGGATGSLQRVLLGDEANTGQYAGQLTLDVSGGSGWGSLYRTVNPSVAAEQVTFAVRSETIPQIGFRAVDSDGQTFNQRINLDPGAEGWQEIVVTDFADGLNIESWGGTIGQGDGIWRGDLTNTSITLSAWQVPEADRAEPVELLVDSFVAWATPPALSLDTIALGNIFEVGDDVAIAISSGAVEVDWVVRDIFGSVVETGSATPAELAGRIALGVTGPGYFEVQVTATQFDGTVHQAYTDVAVLEPFDIGAADDAYRIGVATHYALGWNPESIPLIAKGGFGHARDEARWATEELQRGVFQWPAHQLAYWQDITDHDIERFFIYAYGNNALYPRVGDMTTDEGRTAYTAYALRATDQFSRIDPDTGRDSTIYEVWNEWNVGSLGSPCPPEQLAQCVTGANYFHTLRDTYETVKAEHATATIVAGVQAGYNGGWFTDLFNAGGYDYLDAISFHPYTYPGAAEPLIGYINDANARMAPFAGDDPVKPIVISELGWPTGIAARSSTEEHQANSLVRSIAIALTMGVERYTIYGLMDRGLDQTDTEMTFGVIRNHADPRGAYTPKPSYVAVANLARQISGRDAVSLDQFLTGAYDAVFEGDTPDEALHILWSASPRTVELHTAGPVEVTDLAGVTETYVPSNGVVTLSLGESAVYAHGEITDITEGGAFSLTAGATVVGSDVDATFTADNSDGAEVLEIEVLVEGQAVPLSVPAGEVGSVEIALPGLDVEGRVSYTGIVRSGGANIARVTTTVDIVAAASIEAVHALTDDGEHVLRVRVWNGSAQPLAVTSLSWEIGGDTGSALVGGSVPAESGEVVDVPIANPSEITAYTVTLDTPTSDPVVFTGSLRPLTEPVASVPRQTVTVDGEVDDAVRALPGIDLLTRATPPTASWDGAEDLSGTLWFTWDDDNVYFTAEIVDDVHHQEYSGEPIWQGDGIQLTYSAGTPGEHAGWSEIGIALGPDGASTWRWMSAQEGAGVIPGADYAVSRDDDTGLTVYELAVPWERLGPLRAEDRLLSTSVVVNENDGAGRTGWFAWGGGIATGKSSTLFNPARLDQEYVEPEDTTPPEVSAVFDEETRTVTITATDEGSGVASVEYRLGTDAAWQEYTGPVAVGDDAVVFQYRATDVAGNTSEVGSIDIPAVPPVTIDFIDVPEDHPFHAEITWLAQQGIAQGYEDGTFLPSAVVSRQALAAFLYRLAGSPDVELPDEATFTDVPATHPFIEEIEWAAAEGIVAGYGDGLFRPGATVSRQAAAAFMHRFAGEPEVTVGAATFPDVPTGHPFFEAIEWIAAVGVTTGYEDGSFRPGNTVSRQAVAAWLYRLDGLD